MNRRTQWIAVVAAVVGAGAQLAYLKRFEAEVSGGPRTTVLAAKRDISTGTKLTEDLFALREIPEAYLDLRHIAAGEREMLLGQVLSTSVRAGESLLWSDLEIGGSIRDVLADRVRLGMRAVTLRASGDGGFGEMLRPGDRVDVLVSGGITLMQNVIVLAVGGELGASEPTKTRRTAGASHVTVSVTPVDAERVANIEPHARITLTLRNPDDVERTDRASELANTLGVHGAATTRTTELEHAR